MLTVRKLLDDISGRLSAAGIDCASAEAEWILMHLAGISRLELYSRNKLEVPQERLEEVLARRCRREPLQYILGEAFFMNLRLEVEPGVLIPRPETELLVERVCVGAPPGGAVCDIGTGSGAIGLSVAYERPDLSVTAVDISPEACRIAEANRRRLGLSNIKIFHSDLFNSLSGSFDVIAANLPYVTEAEYADLQPEVKNHEPKLALTSGEDGLDLIRRIIAAAPEYLNRGGILILEIGASQGPTVAGLMAVDFKDVEIIRDYNGLDRHVIGCFA